MTQERFNFAKPKIVATFMSSGIRVFKKRQLAAIVARNRRTWGLQDVSFEKFLPFLLEQSDLRQITLKSKHPKIKDEVRYTWQTPSVYAVALSIKNNSYLTHQTSMILQGLCEESPKAIYVNYEQSPKPKGSLSQEGIDRAFANAQRQSKFTFSYEGAEIFVINGQFSNKLQVTRIAGTRGELLDVTTLERTLIDATKRPAYAGGVAQILKAFRKAKPSLSVTALIETLNTLDYVYPYHQAIGFYMDRAGYSESDTSKLLALGISFDFYLAYQLESDRKFDEKWRVYYPRTLDSNALAAVL